MRHLPLFILLLLFVGGAYLRLNQPKQWNLLLAALRVPEPGAPTVENLPQVAAVPPAQTTVLPATAPVSAIPAVLAPPAPSGGPATTAPAPVISLIPTTPPPPWTSPNPLPAQANWTWITTKGTTFSHVIVAKVEPDCVTIIDDTGGSLIDIADLPPVLQKQLNYDPAAAKYAALVRAQDDINSKTAIEAERAKVRDEIKADTAAAAAAPANTPPPVLSDSDKELMQQQIRDLRRDINLKLRQIVAAYSTGEWGHNSSSQSTYRDAVSDEADEVSALETKLGIPVSPRPIFYDAYPYYYYPYTY